MRPVELRRGLEALAVDGERGHQLLRREVRGEGVGQAIFGGDLRAERARPQDPQRHMRAGRRHRLHLLARLHVREPMLELEHVLGKAIGVVAAAQRLHGELVGARRAAEPEVDPVGEEPRQRAELLGDDQRRMIGQHDPARAHTDRLRARRDMAEDDRCRRAGDPRHVVMLGHPEAAIAPALGMGREIARIVERPTGVGLVGHADQIENRKCDHESSCSLLCNGPAAQCHQPRREWPANSSAFPSRTSPSRFPSREEIPLHPR